MSQALRASLISLLLGSALTFPLLGRSVTQESIDLSERLERALNKTEGGSSSLNTLFTPEQLGGLEERILRNTSC